jgi:hypothetical protein
MRMAAASLLSRNRSGAIMARAKSEPGASAGRHLDAICYDIPVESGRIIIVLEPPFRD